MLKRLLHRDLLLQRDASKSFRLGIAGMCPNLQELAFGKHSSSIGKYLTMEKRGTVKSGYHQSQVSKSKSYHIISHHSIRLFHKIRGWGRGYMKSANAVKPNSPMTRHDHKLCLLNFVSLHAVKKREVLVPNSILKLVRVSCDVACQYCPVA